MHKVLFSYMRLDIIIIEKSNYNENIKASDVLHYGIDTRLYLYFL